MSKKPDSLKVSKRLAVVICPYCKDPFKRNDDVTRCNSCGTFSHRECSKNGCLVYGCPEAKPKNENDPANPVSATKEFFFLKWDRSIGEGHIPSSGFFTAEGIQELLSDPKVLKLKEKSQLTDPIFERKYWVVWLDASNVQVLSTSGLIKALAKYQKVEYWSGPWISKEDAESDRYDQVYGYEE